MASGAGASSGSVQAPVQTRRKAGSRQARLEPRARPTARPGLPFRTGAARRRPPASNTRPRRFRSWRQCLWPWCCSHKVQATHRSKSASHNAAPGASSKPGCAITPHHGTAPGGSVVSVTARAACEAHALEHVGFARRNIARARYFRAAGKQFRYQRSKLRQCVGARIRPRPRTGPHGLRRGSLAGASTVSFMVSAPAAGKP